MKLKDMYEDLLLPEGTNYHRSQLLTNEALTPLSESFIVIQWLNSIDPRLPKYIKENRTQWFNDATPSWADIQPLIVENMETLLLEVHKSNEEESDPVRIGKFNLSQASSRGRNRLSKSRAAPPRSRFCDICKNSGKEERIFKSHWVTQCHTLSAASKQACAKASLRSLLTKEEDA